MSNMEISAKPASESVVSTSPQAPAVRENQPASVMNPDNAIIDNTGMGLTVEHADNGPDDPNPDLPLKDVLDRIKSGQFDKDSDAYQALLYDYCYFKDAQQEINKAIKEALKDKSLSPSEKANLEKLQRDLKNAQKEYNSDYNETVRNQQHFGKYRIGYHEEKFGKNDDEEDVDMADAADGANPANATDESEATGKTTKKLNQRDSALQSFVDQMFEDLTDEVNEYGYTKDAAVLEKMAEYKALIQQEFTPKEQAKLCRMFREKNFKQTQRMVYNLFPKDVAKATNSDLADEAYRNNDRLLHYNRLKPCEALHKEPSGTIGDGPSGGGSSGPTLIFY